MPDGTVIPSSQTSTPVDIDQLFNTFDRRTREGLSEFIQGQATVYTGNEEEANQAYKYLAPGLQSTTRLLEELTRDDQTFSEFLASGSSVLGAIAERRDDLAALTSNANQALGAIADQNEAFDRSLVALPPALRQANTTFVNLRAALDDLDPLIQATGEATPQLTPFLRRPRERRRPLGARVPQPEQGPAPRRSRERPRRHARGAARRPAARLLLGAAADQGLRREPAEHRPAAPLRARPARVPRPLRPGVVELRRQRPLRARPADRDQLLQLEPGHQRRSTRPRPRSSSRTSTAASSTAAPAARRSRSPAPTRSSTTARSRASATRPTVPAGP